MHSLHSHELGLSLPLWADARFVVCVICALFILAEKNRKLPKVTAAAPLHPFPYST